MPASEPPPEPPPSSPIADRAMVRAWLAWGHDPAIWQRLSPEWRDRLRSLFPRESPAEARLALREELAAEIRHDPQRVHASWWVRALKDETPAVRAAAASAGTAKLRQALQLALGSEAPAPQRRPHPEAVRWAATLWAERLIGGPERTPDDPWIVTSIAQLDRHDLFSLVQLIDRAKSALAEGLPDLEPGPIALARHDAERHSGEVVKGLPRLGLIPIGRLLVGVDPTRVRWTLQHLPYQAAKFVRAHMSVRHPVASAEDLIRWETDLVRAALGELLGSLFPGEAGSAGEGAPP